MMFQCENCEFIVGEDFDFCPKCGTLFNEYACENHDDKEGEGVCLVCDKVCCSECGVYYNDQFLCNEHSELEIYQSMVNVHTSCNAAEIDYLNTMLAKNDFHPVRMKRKSDVTNLGGEDLPETEDSENRPVDEMKILVPLIEYLEAVKLVEEILSSGVEIQAATENEEDVI